jgi:hypothetical protein
MQFLPIQTSIYMMYEYPELVRRGIEIIQQLIGG